MSEDGDIDVESAEDVPDIGVEATATTINSNGDLYEDASNPDKRAHHNALERRRRDHIKDSFHGLRDCIPSLVGEKVSRAHILNKATEYIRHMQKGGSTREDDICDMARKNEILEEQVRALDEAKSRGGPINAEDVLQSVANRVEARQQQEKLQQVPSKNNSKSTKQVANKPLPKPASSSSSSTPLSSNSSEKSSPKSSRTTDTPTSSSSQLLNPNFNLLANNIKSTQSLLDVLQKNFSPNNNLPSSIKSLAARVLASPLVRNAQKNATQKTSQASSVPRGIVTATTVNSTKGTPPAATPLLKQSSSSSSRVTGISAALSNQQQSDDSAQIVPVPLAKGDTISQQITESLLASCDIIDPTSLQAISGSMLHAPSQECPRASSPPSTFLTSQILEAHNLLQQQGSSLNSIPAAGGDLGGAVPLTIPPPEEVVGVSDPSSSSSSALTAAAQGLNISPELLAQVTSLFNFPVPATTADTAAMTSDSYSPVIAETISGGGGDDDDGGGGASLYAQDTPSQLPSQTTPATNPHKRPASIESPEPPSKKPHL